MLRGEGYERVRSQQRSKRCYIDWPTVLGLVLLTTLVVLFSVFLAVTGHDRSELKDVEFRLRSQFPHNQLEMTSQHVFGTIENVYQMSDFAAATVASLDPMWIGQLIQHVNAMLNETETGRIKQLITLALDKATHAIEQVDPAVVGELIGNANRVVAGLDTEGVNTLLGNVNALLADGKVQDILLRLDALVVIMQDQHLMEHIAATAANVQEISENVKKLHEIKVQL